VMAGRVAALAAQPGDADASLDRGVALCRSHRWSNAAAVLRRTHRGDLQLAGTDSFAARGSQVFRVRLSRTQRRCAHHRQGAADQPPARRLPAPVGRPHAHHRAAHRYQDRFPDVVGFLRCEGRRCVASPGGRGAPGRGESRVAHFRGNRQPVRRPPQPYRAGAGAVPQRQGACAQIRLGIERAGHHAVPGCRPC
jgi:hypothetical protein